MSTFLQFLFQNTLAGTAFIAAVLLFRAAAKGLSKLYVRILWITALLVLLLPPLPLGTLRTARSLISDARHVLSTAENTERTAPENAGTAKLPSGPETSAPSSDAKRDSHPDVSGDTAPGAGRISAGTGNLRAPAHGTDGVFSRTLFALWALGAGLLLTAGLRQWHLLKRSVSDAVKIQPDVWSCGGIDTPFVMPGLPAKIYVPLGLTEQDEYMRDVLNHERRHIRNHDPLIRCAALPVLLLHWFNPFVWLALRLMNRDTEMYCDECVLRTADAAQRQHYAQTLLDLACQKSGFLPAVYFGESSTGSRIRHILNMKRLRTPARLSLLALILVCGFSFLVTGTATAQEADSALSEKPLEGQTDIRPQKLLPAGSVAYRAADSTKTDMQEERLGPQTGEESSAKQGIDDDAPQEETLQDEEFWADKTVVGDSRPGKKADADRSGATLLEATAHFALYGKKDADAVIVETPDDSRICAEIPYTSTYDVPPALLEHDFDGDGENELSVITWVMHGTGVSIRSLFMADHTSDGAWKLFHYRDLDYMDELTPHFATKYDADGVHLLFDGEITGVAEQVAKEELDNRYGYYAGSQINFRFVEDTIVLRAKLAGYSKINHSGEFPGHELDAQVHYLGEGVWQLADIRYADAGIIDLMEEAIPVYLTGQPETIDFSEYYAVPGVTLHAPATLCRTAEILSVTHSTDDLDKNRANVRVLVRRDGEARPVTLDIPVKRVPLDFGGMWWRIAGEIR